MANTLGKIYEQGTVLLTGELTDNEFSPPKPINDAEEVVWQLFGPNDYFEENLLSLGQIENLDEGEEDPVRARYRTTFLLGQEGEYEWTLTGTSSEGDIAPAGDRFWANRVRETS